MYLKKLQHNSDSESIHSQSDITKEESTNMFINFGIIHGHGENFGLPGTLKNRGGAREGGDFFTPPG